MYIQNAVFALFTTLLTEAQHLHWVNLHITVPKKRLLIILLQPAYLGLMARQNGQIRLLCPYSWNYPSKIFQSGTNTQMSCNKHKTTYNFSIDTIPFQLSFGIKMNINGTDRLKELMKQEYRAQFEVQWDDFRKNMKKQILEVQQENHKT